MIAFSSPVLGSGLVRNFAAGVFFLFYMVFYMAPPALAAHANFSQIADANIQILSSAQCREDYVASRLAKIREHRRMKSDDDSPFFDLNFLSWVPDGSSGHLDAAGCEPDRIERLFLNSRGSTEKQASALREFFQRCDHELRADAPGSLQALVNTVETEYNLCDHPNMRKVVIRIPDGDLIRGILAIKPGTTPRPLVIAKCGVLCDVGDSSMRWMLMHLFDEGPFNVLALANNSGSDFIRDNGYLAPGGFQEGQQIIQIARMVRFGELGKRTSSMHFVGVSLGSHAGLFASYINGFNKIDDVPLLASATATCPVVDLQDAMNGLFKTPLKNELARLLFDNAVTKIVTGFPGLHSLFQAWDDLDTDQLPDQIARQSVDHYRATKSGWQIAPFQGTRIRTIEDFWKANSFLDVARAPMLTPTFVIAAEDDEVVDTPTNASALSRLALKVRRALAGLAGSPKQNLDALILTGGDHCAFSQIYGWRTASALYRSHVIANSPDLIARRHIGAAKFPAAYDHENRAAQDWPASKRYTSVFKFFPGVASIRVTSRFFVEARSMHDACARPMRGAPESCFFDAVMDIPFTQLSPRPSWAQIPTTQAEAEGLTRWANVQMKLVSSEGEVLDESLEDATQLRWISLRGGGSLTRWTESSDCIRLASLANIAGRRRRPKSIA